MKVDIRVFTLTLACALTVVPVIAKAQSVTLVYKCKCSCTSDDGTKRDNVNVVVTPGSKCGGLNNLNTLCSSDNVTDGNLRCDDSDPKAEPATKKRILQVPPGGELFEQ